MRTVLSLLWRRERRAKAQQACLELVCPRCSDGQQQQGISKACNCTIHCDVLHLVKNISSLPRFLKRPRAAVQVIPQSSSRQCLLDLRQR